MAKNNKKITDGLDTNTTSSGTMNQPGISGVYLPYIQGNPEAVKQHDEQMAAYYKQNPIASQPDTTSKYPTTGYQGLAGVNDNTAAQVGKYQQDYKPSEAVTAAQQQLAAIQAQKPQGYESKYGAQLDNILQQITNPKDFKYSFNGDELFKSYADEYTQRGKQASLDAMGQAAALTGGYGNSYAQNAGNQAHQQWLLGLYDKGMDLYDRAYQRYQDDQNGQLNQYNVLANADDTDYGRYRDTVGDWQNERNYYTDLYNTENDRDWNRYNTMLDYWTGLAQVENADYRNDQERQEAIRQYEKDFAEKQREFDAGMAQDDKQLAYNYVMSILANGQMPSEELLLMAGLSPDDAEKLIQKLTKGGSGGGGYPKTTTPQVTGLTPEEVRQYQDIWQQAYLTGQEKLKNVQPIDTAEPYTKNKKVKLSK